MDNDGGKAMVIKKKTLYKNNIITEPLKVFSANIYKLYADHEKFLFLHIIQ